MILTGCSCLTLLHATSTTNISGWNMWSFANSTSIALPGRAILTWCGDLRLSHTEWLFQLRVFQLKLLNSTRERSNFTLATRLITPETVERTIIVFNTLVALNRDAMKLISVLSGNAKEMYAGSCLTTEADINYTHHAIPSQVTELLWPTGCCIILTQEHHYSTMTSCSTIYISTAMLSCIFCCHRQW